MNLFERRNASFIPIHFAFWVLVWFFFVYFFSYNSDNAAYITWFSSFLLPVTMVVTYVVNYYLIPNFLLQKKYKTFLIYSVYTLIFSTYLIMLSLVGCFLFLTSLNMNDMPPMSRNYVFVLILVYLIVLVVSFINLLNNNFQTIAKNKDLENKILLTQIRIKDQELQYLKKQIHPHFLFNTLNTIYGFALKKSEQTPEIILKLSNLLDYILYQVNKPKVTLQEEISHIREYIDLEKIRFREVLDIEFATNNIPENIEIAPMIFLPFVENAFKHGNLIDGFLTIKISFEFVGNQLVFKIKNTSLNELPPAENAGIGLQNIRKRLDLLYSKKYDLKIEKVGEWFAVELTLN